MLVDVVNAREGVMVEWIVFVFDVGIVLMVVILEVSVSSGALKPVKVAVL